MNDIVTASVASLLAGVACGLAAFRLHALARPAVAGRAEHQLYDDTRRERLLRLSPLYKVASGLVDRLAKWNGGRMSAAACARLASELKASGSPIPWTPEEYVALHQLTAALTAVAAAGLAVLVTGSAVTGVVIGLLFGVTIYTITSRDAAAKAAARRKELLARLPFALDLIALMMASGVGFQEAVETAATETAGHPLGDELGEVVRDIRHSRSRREALLGLEERVSDPGVSDLVFALVKGEELGTPLGVAVRQQADQMRLRRTHQREKEAAEAQVGIVFPGFLIMIACVLIVTTPFVLRAMGGAGGLFN